MITSLAGTLGIFLVGLLSDHVDSDTNLNKIGYITGGSMISSISLSVPFFFMVGLSYNKTILRQQLLVENLSKSVKDLVKTNKDINGED